MVFNPALLLVSAIFFLATSAVLFVAASLIANVLFRKPSRRVRRWERGVLFLLLLFPPLVAGALTEGGAFLRHSHLASHNHHSVYCDEIAQFLSVPQGKLPVVVGDAVQVSAWLLLVWGVGTALRLLYVTHMLECALRPFLKVPSAKLQKALRHAQNLDKLEGLKFFEAEIPMSRSCLLGLWHVRCILSSELVRASTDEELAAVVLHEANHYRAGDVGRTLCVGFLNCIFCHLPPVRLLSRRWRETTELACDAATTVATGDPLSLASAILRIQKSSIRSCPLPAVVLGFAEDAACAPEIRIERLIAYAERQAVPAIDADKGFRQWGVTIMLAILGLLLLTPQVFFTAHCSLEAISRSLR